MGKNKDKLFLNTNMYLFSFEIPIGVLKIDAHNFDNIDWTCRNDYYYKASISYILYSLIRI